MQIFLLIFFRCLRGPYGKGLVGHCTSGHSLNPPVTLDPVDHQHRNLHRISTTNNLSCCAHTYDYYKVHRAHKNAVVRNVSTDYMVLLLLLLLPAVSVNCLTDRTFALFPFGTDVGDRVVHVGDDASSPAINIATLQLRFINVIRRTVYVSLLRYFSVSESFFAFFYKKSHSHIHYSTICPEKKRHVFYE